MLVLFAMDSVTPAQLETHCGSPMSDSCAGCTFQKAIISSFDSALCLQNNTFKALRAFHQSVSQALIFVATGTNSAPRNRVAVGRTASFTLTVCLAVASNTERDSPFQKYLGTRSTGQ